MDAVVISRERRDLVALTVLAFLTERPRHPYEMQRLIRDRRKDFAAGPPRRLYHAVAKLAGDGLVEPAEVSREGKRPERTVYRITDEGRAEFVSWLSELLTYPVPEHPLFEAAVSFAIGLPAAEARRALQARAVMLDGQIAALDTQLAGMREQLPRVVLLETEYVLALRWAELRWVREVIADLGTDRLPWDIAKPTAINPATDQRSLSESEDEAAGSPLRLIAGERGGA